MAATFKTPGPPLDITTVFPELSGFARTTFRLHPRPGQPTVQDSSVGGPLLWPADEPWPVCVTAHEGQREIEIPLPDITTVKAAREWALRTGLSVHIRPGGSAIARVTETESRLPDPPCPLAGVLQLYAHDVPDLPFPDGTDLLQILWCPNQHAPWLWHGPRPEAFWRRAADAASVLRRPPRPVFDEKGNARTGIPCRACCILSRS